MLRNTFQKITEANRKVNLSRLIFYYKSQQEQGIVFQELSSFISPNYIDFIISTRDQTVTE